VQKISTWKSKKTEVDLIEIGLMFVALDLMYRHQPPALACNYKHGDQGQNLLTAKIISMRVTTDMSDVMSDYGVKENDIT